MIRSLKSASLALLFASAATMIAVAQDSARMPVSAYAKPEDYPKANAAEVGKHYNSALKLAGNDLYVFFDTLCVQDQLYHQRITGVQYEGLIPAERVFDNLFYVGQMYVSAWAINTPDGIILIDTLSSADEARDIIVAGLKNVGLDPARIKYVIITHAHDDHYGGAKFLKDTYRARLVASAADWEMMERQSTGPVRDRRFDHAPRRAGDDIIVGDGQTISLGGEDVHLALTPGHTPGTLSLWFKVTDSGQSHVAAVYGGLGTPRTDELKQVQIDSMAHWMDVTKAAHVDAQIGNHPMHFDGPGRLETLKYRPAGSRNPFVIGNSAYERFMGMMTECVKMALARDGVSQ
jgi:metallo-beta-lactamase class B